MTAQAYGFAGEGAASTPAANRARSLPARGRRPMWIGLDVGGTRLKGGALDAKGRIVARAAEPTQPAQPITTLEWQLNRLVARLVRQAGGVLAGIGVAITGPVDPKTGCVHLPGKIRGLAGHPTVPRLRARWRVPAVADNDGRLACYAEWKLGAGRGVDNLLVLTLGTGIGSGVVMDGRLLSDRHLQRGTQCGHFVIQVDGPRCLTGACGTGESVGSVTALVQDVRGAMARGLPMDFPAGTSIDAIAFHHIVAAVRRREPVVVEIFERWLQRFGAVLLNTFYAYTPDLILLAGGPTRAASLFVKRLEARLNAEAFRVPVGYAVPIRVARFGEDAGWVGAAWRARELPAGDPATERSDASGRRRARP